MSGAEAPGRELPAAFPGPRHDHEACVARALVAAEALCRQRGARLTALRRRVLELVWSNHEPVKAYDLLEALRRERDGATPPTVYRALEFLRAAELIHRLESLNAFVGCAEPGRRHVGQFLICARCQRVAELSDSGVSGALERTAHAAGFRITAQVVELQGVCDACRD